MPKIYVRAPQVAITPANELVSERGIRDLVGEKKKNKHGEVDMLGYRLGVDQEGAYLEW